MTQESENQGESQPYLGNVKMPYRNILIYEIPKS